MRTAPPDLKDLVTAVNYAAKTSRTALTSTLVVAVTDKQADIAILRTLGASPGSIIQVFMIQGAMIGVIAKRAAQVAVARARGEAFPIPATPVFMEGSAR